MIGLVPAYAFGGAQVACRHSVGVRLPKLRTVGHGFAPAVSSAVKDWCHSPLVITGTVGGYSGSSQVSPTGAAAAGLAKLGIIAADQE